MAKILGVVSRKRWEMLERFDYGDLYSARKGVNPNRYWEPDDAVKILAGVNKFGRLYILVDIGHGSHLGHFDFDKLREALDWVMRRVEVVG